MEPDDHVCLCFGVSKRKIVNFCKREKPAVASLISECLSAGTGCGWCIPFLKQLHKQVAEGDQRADVEMSSEEYAENRKTFRKTGQRPQDSD